jgi:predicted TIM-barrel fold metal-dependent hydrolase
VQLGALFRRHPKTNVIWAHMGLGRIVRPVTDQLAMIDRALARPDMANVYIDLSWDEVAPTDQSKYLKVYDLYQPLFAALTPEASEKFRKGNYERLFDEARRSVRAWERANVK